jgi:hypothetical protein
VAPSEGTKSGIKFNDLNADGDQDPGEPVLSGWTIRAYKDTNGDGDLDPGETTVAASDTTGDGTGGTTLGAYSLTLDPGKYVVCEVTQSNWKQTRPAAAGNQCGDSVSGLGDGGYPITVTSGSTDSDNDFGNTPLSKIKVEFLPQAKLADGTTDATKATSITCNGNEIGSSVGSSSTNTLTTDAVTLDQSKVRCTIEFKDP